MLQKKHLEIINPCVNFLKILASLVEYIKKIHRKTAILHLLNLHNPFRKLENNSRDNPIKLCMFDVHMLSFEQRDPIGEDDNMKLGLLLAPYLVAGRVIVNNSKEKRSTSSKKIMHGVHVLAQLNISRTEVSVSPTCLFSSSGPLIFTKTRTNKLSARVYSGRRNRRNLDINYNLLQLHLQPPVQSMSFHSQEDHKAQFLSLNSTRVPAKQQICFNHQTLQNH